MPTNDPNRTSDHVPGEQTGDHSPKPTTFPPHSPPASTFDPNRTTGHYPSATPTAEEVVPGYELLAEVGRGGMGVVYQARQIALNRIVALKMILGGRAGERELIRFLAEAEAVAGIRHPNVVQVHEYGQAGGCPYMALEYLSGGTLSRRLPKANEPESPAGVAQLLASIARGVAAAHAAGIIHRDLKPGNVLFDEHGNPKVADFGLAKRIGGSDLTATQAVMGTPAYMSPEQADGKTKFVGPQADVWALGVVLYELLTGERPFEADDVQGILARILTTDPVSPRKLIPSLPRDLESICLKCLAKQPHERYPTAKELADDLDRFLRHEPISIRPAGPLERAAKWVRRNKVVAGSMAAVAIALLIGSGVAIVFGLEARDQAKFAKEETNRATDAANDAIEKGVELGKANVELEKANTELLDTLAGAQLGRVAIHPQRAIVALNFSEMHAFHEIAARRGTPVAAFFLNHTTDTLVESRQLEGRAPFVLHAAIGLDPEARDRADKLLFTAMNAPATPLEQRRAIAVAVARWEAASPPTAARAAQILAEMMDSSTNPFSLETPAGDLVLLARRMEPGAGLQLVSDMIIRHPHPIPLTFLLGGLPAVAKRVDRAMLPAVAKTLIDTMTKLRQSPDVNTPLTQGQLAQALATLAELMDPAARKAACEASVSFIVPILTVPNQFASSMDQKELIAALVRFTASLDAKVSAKLLTDVLLRTNHPDVVATIVGEFTSLTNRLEPATLTSVVMTITDMLGRPMGRAPRTADGLTRALVAVADRVEPATATAAAKALIGLLTKPLNPADPWQVEKSLAAMTARLDRSTATTLAQSTAETLTRTTDATALSALALGLAVVSTRMESTEAATLCGGSAKHLTDVMAKTSDGTILPQLTRGVALLADRMKPGEAAEISATASRIIVELPSKPGRTWSVECLSMLAERLDSATAAAGAKTIIDTMLATTDVAVLAASAKAVALLAERLTPKAAAEVCSLAVKPLTTVLLTANNAFQWIPPIRGLEALAKHLDPTTAAMVAKTLTETMARSPIPNTLGPLGKTLSAISARLDRKTAATWCSLAVKVLTDTMTNQADASHLPSLLEGLAPIAPYLSPTAAAAAAKTITDKIHRMTHADRVTTNVNTVMVNQLVKGLLLLVVRMEPSAATMMWKTITEMLTEELGKVLISGELERLIHSLSLVVGHVDAATETAIAKSVIQAFAPGRSVGDTRAGIFSEVRGLSRIVTRLDAKTTNDAAHAIVNVLVMSQTSRLPDYRLAFWAAVFGIDPEATRQSLMLAVGSLGSPTSRLGGLSALHPHSLSQPRLLPPQMLVDLLKNPLCVGETRRTVLDALEMTYSRPFADQWDFVRYVKDNRLPLDLLTPPKRPQRER